MVRNREATSELASQGQAEPSPDSAVTGETALSSDHKEIEELRKNIPAEKRRENDALKEMLSLTGELKDPPSRIREKYNRMASRERDQQRRSTTREREEFNRNEKNQREKFYRELNKERDEFKSKKADRESSRKFFDDQDRRRREFSADERDRRNQFNADLKQKQDDFNQMTRDRQQDFSQQMRDYEQRYREWQADLKAGKKNTLNMGVTVETNVPVQTGSQAPVPVKAGTDRSGK